MSERPLGHHEQPEEKAARLRTPERTTEPTTAEAEYAARMAQLDILERGTGLRPGTAGDIRGYINRLVAIVADLALKNRALTEALRSAGHNLHYTKANHSEGGHSYVSDSRKSMEECENDYCRELTALLSGQSVQVRDSGPTGGVDDVLAIMEGSDTRDEELERLRKMLKGLTELIAASRWGALWKALPEARALLPEVQRG